ncbi:MAG: hypothetical protein WCV50_05360 [Patescibacteria group bacterium]|jgi:hypothetical protein
MKKALILLVACLAIGISAGWTSPIQAENTLNAKLLLHGVQKDTSSHWGKDGWFILPNPGSKTTPVVAVAGPRYSQSNWWLELNLGVFGKESKAEALLDVRASYDLTAKWNVWANVEYYGTSKNLYVYLDATLKLGSIGRIGLETENMLYGDHQVDDYGYGPRIVVPFGSQFKLIGAYQFHPGLDKIWARVVIDF